MSKVETYQQEIRDAIEFIEADTKKDEEISMAFGLPRRPPKHYALAITALRAQIEPKKPCEWCEGKEDSLLVWTKEPVEIEWDDREYNTTGWQWKELKPNFCPNCGRQIVPVKTKANMDCPFTKEQYDQLKAKLENIVQDRMIGRGGLYGSVTIEWMRKMLNDMERELIE